MADRCVARASRSLVLPCGFQELPLPGSVRVFTAVSEASRADAASSCRMAAAGAQEGGLPVEEAAAALGWQHVLATKAGSVEQYRPQAVVRAQRRSCGQWQAGYLCCAPLL